MDASIRSTDLHDNPRSGYGAAHVAFEAFEREDYGTVLKLASPHAVAGNSDAQCITPNWCYHFATKMPTTPTSIAQIDKWKAAKSETEHLEFKEARDKFEFYKLLEYCVALANENENGSVLLLGVTDRPPRAVVGTKAFSNISKVASDLFDKLRFRVAVEEVMYADRRVLVFHIPPRPIGHPYELDGKFLMRSGGQSVPMTVDQLKKIFAENEPGSRSAPAYFAAGFLLAASLAGILWFKRSPVATNQPPITANRAPEKSSGTQISPDSKASPDTRAKPAVPPTSDTTPLRPPPSSHSVKAAKHRPTVQQ
jgi:hypothetical protein